MSRSGCRLQCESLHCCADSQHYGQLRAVTQQGQPGTSQRLLLPELSRAWHVHHLLCHALNVSGLCAANNKNGVDHPAVTGSYCEHSSTRPRRTPQFAASQTGCLRVATWTAARRLSSNGLSTYLSKPNQGWCTCASRSLRTSRDVSDGVLTKH